VDLDLAARLRSRDRAAVAAALNLADDQRPGPRAEALAMLDALERDETFPGSARIGVTGAPGAGKSTLLDALVRALRRSGQTVAVVAVDPSSQRTGGALLGDRIRMRSSGTDAGVFIRSMAARDRLGGIAEQTWAAVSILACAFDCVFVETVGVGQSEAAVADLVDTLVFVANPGSGDTLQFMKAGLLELVDVFVVNKADTGAIAQRTARELEAGVRMAEREAKSWEPPVSLVSARDGAGIDALVDTLAAHRRYALDAGVLRARRASGRERFVVEALTRRYGTFGIASIGGDDGVIERLRGAPAQSSFGAIEALGRAIEGALGAVR
jgi:LAO/AO transport system kinase